ncbi:MAG: TetR family transcriptional regulator [Pseudomonadota bacterium]
MQDQQNQRVRRSPEEARALIIASAEKILLREGVQAVQVRAVAREAGMTDAGITHHFSNRDGLLTALLDDGARKTREAISNTVESWVAEEPDIARLVETLHELYRSGYAALALQLHNSGWQDTGQPLLEPVVAPLMARNKNPQTSEEDLRAALASLHQWLALEPLFGSPFRRSAGLKQNSKVKLQLAWWIQSIEAMLGPTK